VPIEQIQIPVGTDVLDARADIEVPTLFVWSTEDPAIAREGAELTGEHVKAPYRFEVFEGEPRWIPDATAERLSGVLLRHVGEHL
jgi:pimeloyl-ACP methyl ester carboxylesterase